jgi:hypothetical protein
VGGVLVRASFREPLRPSVDEGSQRELTSNVNVGLMALRSKHDKEQQDAERDRLEAALEAGLETTFPGIRRCGSNPARARTLHRPKQLTLSKIPVLSLPTAFIPSSTCLTLIEVL